MPGGLLKGDLEQTGIYLLTGIIRIGSVSMQYRVKISLILQVLSQFWEFLVTGPVEEGPNNYSTLNLWLGKLK